MSSADLDTKEERMRRTNPVIPNEPLAIVAALPLALAACQNGGANEGQGMAAEEEEVQLKETAESETSGIEVTATVKAWPGEAFIKKEVTPVRISIDNDSEDKSVDVSYKRFRLVEDDGDVRAALPPFQIEGEAPEVRIGAEYEVIDYDWVGTEYDIYDVYDPIYGDDVVVSDVDWVYEPDYYVDHYTYWADSSLPTTEMLVLALPEGVVRPGGMLQGWMYFEEVDVTADEVTLKADLVDPNTNEKLGEIDLDLDETLLM